MLCFGLSIRESQLRVKGSSPVMPLPPTRHAWAASQQSDLAGEG